MFVSELRRSEGSSAQVNKHVTVLEGLLRQEREEKDKALQLVKRMSTELERMGTDLSVSQRELAAAKAAANQVRLLVCACVLVS